MILQKAKSDTVNDTATPKDTTARLIAAIKEHPEYTYDEYCQTPECRSCHCCTTYQEVEWNGHSANRIGQGWLLEIYRMIEL